ncbi:MAG: very short patch repair endonuclease [Bacteroidales bacterium]|nr:very short patch repair endonuclease [Bacteroidales bacterium]
MSDTMSPSQRHRCMSRIRSKDTKPELKVRKWLWSHGYRYRLNVRSVPGSPDIVMRPYRTAIFVNGCFWHGHGIEFRVKNLELIVNPQDFQDFASFSEQNKNNNAFRIEINGIEDSPCCKLPHTNRDFWVAKIRRNQERDRRNYQILSENGWQVIVVWECQLTSKKIEHTMREVELLLNQHFLDIHKTKVRSYNADTPDALPQAAEDSADYGKIQNKKQG